MVLIPHLNIYKIYLDVIIMLFIVNLPSILEISIFNNLICNTSKDKTVDITEDAFDVVLCMNSRQGSLI